VTSVSAAFDPFANTAEISRVKTNLRMIGINVAAATCVLAARHGATSLAGTRRRNGASFPGLNPTPAERYQLHLWAGNIPLASNV